MNNLLQCNQPKRNLNLSNHKFLHPQILLPSQAVLGVFNVDKGLMDIITRRPAPHTFTHVFYLLIQPKHYFILGVGGHPQQLTCPGNLVFDPTNAFCQYPEVCGKTR
jgi:hypothetical protein